MEQKESKLSRGTARDLVVKGRAIYNRPRLVKYGDVVELTAGTGGSNGDGQAGKTRA